MIVDEKGRQTVRLNDKAFVYGGASGKKSGPYLLEEGNSYVEITNSCVKNGLVTLGTSSSQQHKEIQMVNLNDTKDTYTLRNGDILLVPSIRYDKSEHGIQWGVYRGDRDVAVPVPTLIIIRPKNGSKDEILRAFNTRKGIEFIRNQLERTVATREKDKRIKLNDIRNVILPDNEDLMEEQCLFEAVYAQDKIVSLFSNMGWVAILSKKINGHFFDVALTYNEKTYIIFELQVYTEEQLEKPTVIYRLKDRKHLADVERYYVITSSGKFCYLQNEELLLSDEIPSPADLIAEGNRTKTVKNGDQISGHLIELMRMVAEASKDVKKLQEREEKVFEKVSIVETKIDAIDKKIDELIRINVEQISGLKRFVDSLLKSSDSTQEQEWIFQTLTNECSDKITNTVVANKSKESLEIEQKKLKEALGDQAWRKIDDKAKKFLISARIMFDSLVRIGGDIDYSGVCLLLSKAIEIETHKRFYKGFKAYLDSKYSRSSISHYPSSLLNDYGSPIKPEKYSLGSVAFTLCYLPKGRVKDNDKKQIMGYAREKLMPGKNEIEIQNALSSFAQEIEVIREKYRNPSAHKDTVSQNSAEACFDMVVDVQKLLKRMLETFQE